MDASCLSMTKRWDRPPGFDSRPPAPGRTLPSRYAGAMGQRVGVVATTPTIMRGVLSVLEEAGFQPVEVDGLGNWTPIKDGTAIVITVRDDSSREAMGTFCDDHPSVPVIAIAPANDVGTFGELVRAGASGVVGEDDPTDHLVQVLTSALEGWTAVPVAVARALAARVPPPADPTAWVGDGEISWLRALTDGATVSAIAADSGYSEREMFRVLQRLYQRIGVGNRTEAIVWATRNGLL